MWREREMQALDRVIGAALAAIRPGALINVRHPDEAMPLPVKAVKRGPHYRSHYVFAVGTLLDPDRLYEGPERRKRERRSPSELDSSMSPLPMHPKAEAIERRAEPDPRRRPDRRRRTVPPS